MKKGKMKQFLALALAGMLIVGAVGIPVFGAENDTDVTVVKAVDEVYSEDISNEEYGSIEEETVGDVIEEASEETERFDEEAGSDEPVEEIEENASDESDDFEDAADSETEVFQEPETETDTCTGPDAAEMDDQESDPLEDTDRYNEVSGTEETFEQKQTEAGHMQEEAEEIEEAGAEEETAPEEDDNQGLYEEPEMPENIVPEESEAATEELDAVAEESETVTEEAEVVAGEPEAVTEEPEFVAEESEGPVEEYSEAYADAAIQSLSSMPDLSSLPVLPTDVTKASDGCLMLGLHGAYIEDVNAALTRINEIRLEACREGVLNPETEEPLTESDYVPIKWSHELEWIAMIRAAESAVTRQHLRTNGGSCFAITSPDGISSYGEVLAWNWSSSVIYGINQWYDEKADWVNRTPGAVTGHYTQMIDPGHTYVGIGTFLSEDTAYYNCTAGQFSGSYSMNGTPDESPVGISGECIQMIEVNTSYLDGSAVISGSTSGNKGDLAAHLLTTGTQYKTATSGLILMDGVSWTTSDGNVVRVSGDGTTEAVSCGEADISAQVPAAGLSAGFTYKVEHVQKSIPAVAPTCTHTGSTEGVCCENCGYIFTPQEVLEKLPHSYSEWTVTREPVCTEAGEKKKVCQNCGDTVTEAIPATGHTIVTDASVSPTCTEKGWTEGHHCDVCGAVIDPRNEIPANGHTWNESYTVDVPATCKTEGSRSIHCSVCGGIKDGTVQTIEKIPHSYGEWVTVTEPTYDDSGLKERVCTACGDVEQEVIEKKQRISIENAAITIADQTYTGEALEPEAVVTVDGIELSSGSDYSITYGNNINAGEAAVTINGQGGYIGTKVTTFRINRAAQSITAADLSVTFPGTGIISVSGNEGILTFKSDDTDVAEVDTSGTVTAKGVGTANITITSEATDNYLEAARTIKVTVYIPVIYAVTVDANGGVINNEVDDDTGMEAVNAGTITKRIVEDSYVLIPARHVRNEDDSLLLSGWALSSDGDPVAGFNEDFKPDSDCTLYAVWKRGKYAGDRLYGDLNDNGIIDIGDTLRMNRHIQATQDSSVRSKHPDWIMTGYDYEGADINHDAVISSEDVELAYQCIAARNSEQTQAEHPDWILTETFEFYSFDETEPRLVTDITLNNSEIVIEKGKTAVLIAEVVPADADDTSIAWSSSDAEIAAIDDNGNVTGVSEGTATITAAACDGSGVSAVCEVTVTTPVISIAKTTVTGITSKTYTGSALTQTPVVTLGSTTLKRNTDYKLTYKNNTNAGTATVTITGIGNYKGSISKTFTINKAAQSLTVKVSASPVTVGKTSKVSVTGAKGKKTYKSSNTTRATVSTSGKITTKKVGPVKITVTSASTANYKAASKSITIKIRPKPTSITSLTPAKGAITVKWKKQASQTTGYEIQCSIRSDLATHKSVLITKTGKTSKKVTGLKAKTKYYVRIRTYKTVSGTKFYSAWSAIKTVKTK